MRRHLNVDFTGRWRTWFLASGALLVIAVISLATQGFNLSIDFTGGSSFTVSGITQDVDADEVEDAAADAGAQQPQAQLIREGDRVTGAIVRTTAVEPGSDTENAISTTLEDATGASNVVASFVGPTWGERISAKMAQALVVFLGVVILYLSFRLEFKMSMAAIVALFHDLLLTAGVYSLFQFNVSPATVIALLTILGYSLYDTVIVFDRVHETTATLGGVGRRSYSQAVNTSQNDVLWRSVNTTISSTLPVAALLLVGAQALGATTLQDLALALFVGMLCGAYSSLFVAGPFLSLWKEREPRYARLAERAERKADEDEEVLAQRTRTKREGPQLKPQGYVRGKGKTPRSKRN